MVIVIEGCNGVGKSTYARAIAERTNGRIIRPFRPSDPKYHFTGNTPLEQRLRLMHVPYNTYIDDLYVADMLSQLDDAVTGPVILDRSMPSAIAYDKSLDWPSIMAFWQAKMASLGAHYVWLRSRYDAVPNKERRPSFTSYSELHSTFYSLYEVIGLHKMYMETPDFTPEEGVATVMRWLGLTS